MAYRNAKTGLRALQGASHEIVSPIAPYWDTKGKKTQARYLFPALQANNSNAFSNCKHRPGHPCRSSRQKTLFVLILGGEWLNILGHVSDRFSDLVCVFQTILRLELNFFGAISSCKRAAISKAFRRKGGSFSR